MNESQKREENLLGIESEWSRKETMEAKETKKIHGVPVVGQWK